KAVSDSLIGLAGGPPSAVGKNPPSPGPPHGGPPPHPAGPRALPGPGRGRNAPSRAPTGGESRPPRPAPFPRGAGAPRLGEGGGVEGWWVGRKGWGGCAGGGGRNGA